MILGKAFGWLVVSHKKAPCRANRAETGALLNVADETLIEQTTPLPLVRFNGTQKQINKEYISFNEAGF